MDLRTESKTGKEEEEEEKEEEEGDEEEEDANGWGPLRTEVPADVTELQTRVNN